MVSISDIGISLMIFAFTGWITLPWAFHERIEKHIDKKVKELRKKSIDDEGTIQLIKQPLSWIRQGRRAFLYSGILLLLSLIGEVSQSSLTSQAVLAVELLFVIAVGIFFIACFQTYRVVEYYSNPDYRPERVPWASVSFLTFIFAGELFSITALISILPFIALLGKFTLIAQIYTISLFAGVIGMTWLFLINLKKRDNEIHISIPALILYFSPWVVLAINFILRLGLVSYY